MEEKNKELICIESQEIGSKGNLDIIPELFTEDFVSHFLPDGSKTNGLVELRDRLDSQRKAFPDRMEKIQLTVAQRDLVAVWLIASGTNTGGFTGNSPTDRKTVNSVMSFFRIADKKIAEQWLLPDLYSLNSHLGLIPGEEAIEIDNRAARRPQEIDLTIDSVAVRRNKDLALSANKQVWTAGNFEKLEEMFSDNFVQHFIPLGTRTRGLEEFQKQLIAHRKAFPDWTEVVNLTVAEGDYVFIQFTSTGTNSGSFLGNPPTGKKIKINEMTIFRIADDRIAEQWLLPDILSLNQQLGFIQSDN
jgi:steroid delta-isomerase-like uncharacterized protein